MRDVELNSEMYIDIAIDDPGEAGMQTLFGNNAGKTGMTFRSLPVYENILIRVWYSQPSSLRDTDGRMAFRIPVIRDLKSTLSKNMRHESIHTVQMNNRPGIKNFGDVHDCI